MMPRDLGLLLLIGVTLLILMLGKQMMREKKWMELSILSLILSAGLFLGFFNMRISSVRQGGMATERSQPSESAPRMTIHGISRHLSLNLTGSSGMGALGGIQMKPGRPH